MQTRKTFQFARFEWKLPDLWVGVFWRRTPFTLDVWVCLLPCVPLHLQWSTPKCPRCGTAACAAQDDLDLDPIV